MPIAHELTNAGPPIAIPDCLLAARNTGGTGRRRGIANPPVASRLPLTDAERARYGGGVVIDLAGEECLAGLTRAESLDYLELQRRGLDNDDAAYLRWIRLGDRHIAARRLIR